MSVISIEEANNRRRRARKLANRLNEVRALQSVGFVERYLRGDAHIAIRRRISGEQYQGCIVAKEGFVDNSRHPSSWPQARPKQTAMFPGEVQFVKDAEQITVPSRIWPQVFHETLVGRGKPLYVFEGPGLPVPEVVNALPYREMGASILGVAVACGERARKQVETASDAVDERARLGQEEWVEGLCLDEAVRLVAGLRVVIDDYGVWSCVLPRDSALSQGWELGFGPVDCSLSIDEIVVDERHG